MWFGLLFVKCVEVLTEQQAGLLGASPWVLKELIYYTSSQHVVTRQAYKAQIEINNKNNNKNIKTFLAKVNKDCMYLFNKWPDPP